ncbi:MAG: protein kinase [Puniceicoccales bacterium]|jgi:serine/threonine protein kinase|nr:protein kinase [Puniceicoccales bacterium]
MSTPIGQNPTQNVDTTQTSNPLDKAAKDKLEKEYGQLFTKVPRKKADEKRLLQLQWVLNPSTLGDEFKQLSEMSSPNPKQKLRLQALKETKPSAQGNAIGKTPEGRSVKTQERSLDTPELSGPKQALNNQATQQSSRTIQTNATPSTGVSNADAGTPEASKPTNILEQVSPKDTLSPAEQIKPKTASQDSNTLESLWDNRNPTPLGKGAFGEVFGSADGQHVFKKMSSEEAKEVIINMEINANKVLMSGLETVKQSSDRFYAQGVDFVTKYKGCIDVDGETVLVFERAPGVEMAQFLRDHKVEDENIVIAARMCAVMVTAVSAMDKIGMMHRDIKPENIMVHVAEDGSVTGKLIDQGFAVKTADSRAQEEGAGTPPYIAPEYLKKGAITPAADVFSLGVVLMNTFFKDSPAARGMELGFAREVTPANGFALRKAFQRMQALKGYGVGNFQRDSCMQTIFGHGEETSKRLCDPQGVYSKDQLQFLGKLIQDCLQMDPSKRPSAAQVGFVLEYFAACMDDNVRIQEHNAKPENRDNQQPLVTIPPYQDVMALAKEDRPVKQDQPATT